MIAIYKKLPGTNCGKCGEATCMAFAMKVKKSQATMEDCPFTEATISGETQFQQAPTGFSNYEQASDDLEELALKVDFSAAADAVGGEYQCQDNREAIRLRMLTRHYELRKDGLFRDDKYCSDAWTRIIIYDYLRRQGRKPLTGEWISLGNFPHTASHVKAFQSNAERKVTETFRNNFNGLKQRCSKMLMASSLEQVAGTLNAPEVDEAARTNFLHQRLPALELDLIGFRAPFYNKTEPEKLGPYWEGLKAGALMLARERTVYIGDFNWCSGARETEAAEAVGALLAAGYRMLPEGGGVDRALVSAALEPRGWQVIEEAAGFRRTGEGRLSDHPMLVVDVA